jgi:hypothetical protein
MSPSSYDVSRASPTFQEYTWTIVCFEYKFSSGSVFLVLPCTWFMDLVQGFGREIYMKLPKTWMPTKRWTLMVIEQQAEQLRGQ